MADPLSRNPPQTPLENEEGHRQGNTLSLLLGVLTRSKGKKPEEPMKSVQQCMPNKKRKRQQPSLVCSPPEETLPANNLSGSPFEQNTEIFRGGEEHEEANDSWNPDTPAEDAVTGIPKVICPPDWRWLMCLGLSGMHMRRTPDSKMRGTPTSW